MYGNSCACIKSDVWSATTVWKHKFRKNTGPVASCAMECLRSIQNSYDKMIQYFTLLHEFWWIPPESHGMLEFHSDSARMVGISNSCRFHQIPSGIPGNFHGNSSGIPGNFHGNSREIPMDSQWNLDGIPMDSQWDLNGIPKSCDLTFIYQW